MRRKYPDYCEAIAHKIALRHTKRLEAEAEILTKALTERPTPNLETMRRRLGYASSTSLRYNFPDHCRAIVSQIAEERREFLRARGACIEGLLDRAFLNWEVIEKEIGPRCVIKEQLPELYERLKRRCKELSQVRRTEGRLRLSENLKWAVDKLTSQGVPPTLRQVRNLLPPGTFRGESIVQDSLRRMLRP